VIEAGQLKPRRGELDSCGLGCELTLERVDELELREDLRELLGRIESDGEGELEPGKTVCERPLIACSLRPLVRLGACRELRERNCPLVKP